MNGATKAQRRAENSRGHGLAPYCGDRVYVSAYLHRSPADLEVSLMHRLVGRNMIKWGSLAALASAAILYVSCANGGFGFRREDPLLFSGTIETREIRVGSKVGGRVTDVLVREEIGRASCRGRV